MDVEDLNASDSRGPSLDALRAAIATSGQAVIDTSVERLRSTTGGLPNPSKAAHVAALRVWMNAWNCRIPYPTGDNDPLVPTLDVWWRKYRRRLVDVPINELDDRGLDAYASAYADLVDLEAGVSNIGRVRSLAPTASSKLLWVLRQQTACPWDAAIAKAGGHGSGKDGYANHLRKAREWTREITADAAKRGVDNVAAHVGRPHSSLVRIYDEWCYLTFTRGPVS